ncbi:MAG TPA: hypothetical protein DET40_11355 [Lentisphaeria bacterium]|nr:MAG: hypothetical protein A2X45_19835 [Lentisphaerae bacterium GWF2_50_93]HCE44136.1 hypothetical protein [Lentisphaeria bacterium]
MNIFVTGFSDLSGEKSTPGGMVHLLEVCRNLQGEGNKLTLFVASQKPYRGSLPYKVVYLPFIKMKYLNLITMEISLFLYLMWYGIREKCDVIYENCVFYSITGVFAAKLLGAVHCMHVHGYYVDEMIMGGHGKFRIWIVRMFEYINYKLTDALFCVTPVIREKITADYKIREGVANFVYNGVDAERCRPIPKEKAAAELGLPPDVFYVGFVGYIFPWSGIDKMMEAAPAVIKEFPNTKFVIVGHGIWGDKLPEMAEKAGVKDNFIFAGYQPWEKVPVYCSLFDIGLTPYPAEMGVGRYRSSMKSLEYSAAGTPVIITRCEGVSDIVEKGDCGLVIDPASNTELSDAIIRLLKDPALRERLGKNGRRLIEDNYTWRHIAIRMLEIMSKAKSKK